VVWLAVAAIVVVAVTLYATWAAGRLDRLHARLDASAAAMDAQLRVRSEAALRFAGAPGLPATGAEALRAAAGLALSLPTLDSRREAAESALSRALRSAVGGLDAPDRAAADELLDAATRASIARRFHNDAVRDVLVVRRRRVVRLLHLAGHAPRPAYFEMDDAAVDNSDVAAAAAPYDGNRE
jgi:hypothetical protein